MAELVIIVSIVLAFAGFLVVMYAVGMATVYIVAIIADFLGNIARYFRRY